MWSYNASALGTSAKDRVRLTVGDTDQKQQLLQDEEVLQALVEEGDNEDLAAALCCDWISRLFLRRADVELGRALKVTYSKMAKQWSELAGTLRGRSSTLGLPYVGGRVLAEKEAAAADSSLVQPLFTKRMGSLAGSDNDLRGPDWD